MSCHERIRMGSSLPYSFHWYANRNDQIWHASFDVMPEVRNPDSCASQLWVWKYTCPQCATELRVDARYTFIALCLGALLSSAVLFRFWWAAAVVSVAIVIFLFRYGPKRWTVEKWGADGDRPSTPPEKI